MTLKNVILELLLSGNFVSGEEIAQKAGVSRAAVWKSVQSLRKDGYRIEAITNKGYFLDSENLLTRESIVANLPEPVADLKINVYKSVSSTNDLAREAAERGENNVVFIADEQTQGRGRMGRRFVSDAASGVYLSLLIRPDCKAEDSALLTTAAAVATCRAAEAVAPVRCSIKWVNDIYAENKKMAGILCEGAFDMENGKLKYAIIGIGTNIKRHTYPPEIAEKAIDLETASGASVSRARYAAQLITSLLHIFSNFSDGAFMEEYRRRSFVTGKDVTVVSGKDTYRAKAKYITDNGSLAVELDSGEVRLLSSGEVSITPFL